MSESVPTGLLGMLSKYPCAFSDLLYGTREPTPILAGVEGLRRAFKDSGFERDLDALAPSLPLLLSAPPPEGVDENVRMLLGAVASQASFANTNLYATTGRDSPEALFFAMGCLCYPTEADWHVEVSFGALAGYSLRSASRSVLSLLLCATYDLMVVYQPDWLPEALLCHVAAVTRAGVRSLAKQAIRTGLILGGGEVGRSQGVHTVAMARSVGPTRPLRRDAALSLLLQRDRGTLDRGPWGMARDHGLVEKRVFSLRAAHLKSGYDKCGQVLLSLAFQGGQRRCSTLVHSWLGPVERGRSSRPSSAPQSSVARRPSIVRRRVAPTHLAGERSSAHRDCTA